MRSVTFFAEANPIQTVQSCKKGNGWPLWQAYLPADSYWFPSQSSTAPSMLIGFGDTYYRITAKTCQLRNFCAMWSAGMAKRGWCNIAFLLASALSVHYS